MKIAMIGQKGIPAQSGGVEQHVDILSRLLVERGHDVVVYCRRSYCGRDAVSTRTGGLHRLFRPSLPTKHLDAITHSLTSTLDVVFRRADVVHFHAIGPAALAPLARLAGLPVVVTCHGLDWQRAKWGGFAKRCLQFGQWLGAKSANQLIVVSPVLRQYFQEQHRVASRFIPNGVMPLHFADPTSLGRFGIEPQRYLLAASRLVPEKGLHYLLEAFSRVRTDWKLVIAGGGGFDMNYERRLRELAGSNVIFTGPADRALMAELYSHTRLFVLPSDLEGMSIALLEAMSMGVPVLASDIPENTCVVERAGETFRQGNVADLAAKLQGLLDAPHRLAALGVAGAKQVAPFQWNSVVDQLEEVYAACGGRSPARRAPAPAAPAPDREPVAAARE